VQYISVKKYIINEALNGLDVGNVLYSLHGYLYAGGGGGSQGGLEPPKKFFGLFLASERCEANREGSLYSFLVGFRN
jgi:hypothetical protein